ncbi:hypothetical protein ACFVMS_004456 [Salmonella enterica]
MKINKWLAVFIFTLSVPAVQAEIPYLKDKPQPNSEHQTYLKDLQQSDTAKETQRFLKDFKNSSEYKKENGYLNNPEASNTRKEAQDYLNTIDKSSPDHQINADNDINLIVPDAHLSPDYACKVAMCMYGEVTGNSGGSDCRNPVKKFFSINAFKKHHRFNPGKTFDMRKSFLGQCPDLTKEYEDKILSRFGRVRG